MSAKKSFKSWSGIKSTTHRLKQKAMVKLGKSDQTVDVQFNAEKARFDVQYKMFKKMRKDIEKYQKSLRDLAQSHAAMTEAIHNLYESSCPLWNACMAQEKVTNDIDNLRNEFEAHWQTDLFEPLASMLNQYKMIEERCEERDRRRVDMDRYRADLRRVMQNNEAPTKIQIHKEKVDAMTTAYQNMNQELLRDIPALLDDRFAFFDPLFATLVDGQTEYFTKSATSFSRLQEYFNGVDRQLCHSHPRVITDKEHSAYSELLYVPGHKPTDPVDEKDYSTPKHAEEMPESVGHNVRGAGFLTDETGTSSGAGAGAVGAGAAGARARAPSAGGYGGGPPRGRGMPPRGGRGMPPRGGGRGMPVPRGRGMPPRGGGRGMPPRGGGRGMPVPRGGRGMPVPRGRGAPGRAPPARGPPQVRAKALYPFVPEAENELGFQAGEVLIVRNQGGEWWEGELRGQTGLFPASYVQLM